MTTKIIRKASPVKITKRDFEQFAKMWGEGKINMWDIEAVLRHSSFSRLKILAMMRQYSELDKLYPDVWKKIKKERSKLTKE